MRIVSVTYVNAQEYNSPDKWLDFIRSYLGILKELANHHEVYCVEQINYEGQYSADGIKYLFVNYGKRVNRFPFELHRHIKRLNPDIVLVRGLHFPLQILLLRRLLGKKVRIIVQHHASKPPVGIKRILQRKADTVINDYFFAAKAIADEWLQKGVIRDPNKIHEIGTLSSFFQPGEKKHAQQKTKVSASQLFLWVGQLTPNKDPLTVTKAFLRFSAAHQGARLYLIYRETDLLGEMQELLKKEPEGNRRIIMIGGVPHQQLEDWYNSADFFIAGSHAESYGAALSEAMSCGCIPIVTNIPSFYKMTNEGRLGLSYEPGNEEALLSCLTRSLDLNIQEERLQVLKQFKDELSFAAISRKINAIIDVRR